MGDGAAAAATTTTIERQRPTCSRCRSHAAQLKLPGTGAQCSACATKSFEFKARSAFELVRGAALRGRIRATQRHASAPSSASAASGRDAGGATASTPGHAGERLGDYSIQLRDAVDGGAVALGFSGGPSSRALLHTARAALLASSSSHAGRPREVTRLDVIYVDDSALLSESSSTAEKRTATMRAIVEAEQGGAYGLHFVRVAIEDLFQDEQGEGDGGLAYDLEVDGGALRLGTTPRRGDRAELLRGLFAYPLRRKVSRGSEAEARTVAEDLHTCLVQAALRRTARRRGCAALMLGECGTRAAASFIDGLAKGRGFGLATRSNPALWHGDLMIVRPLREVLAKEVAYYNHIHCLETAVEADPVSWLLPRPSERSSGARDKASISTLTESFIRLLEKGVPSTVSTVNRTSDKLVHQGDDDPSLSLGQDNGDGRADGPSVPLRRPAAGSVAATSSPAGPGQSANTTHPRTNASPAPSSSSSRPPPSRPRVAGLGGAGQKLLDHADDAARWDEADACAFCGAPAAAPAAAEVVGASSASMRPDASLHGGEGGGGDWIDLREALCYGCVVLLSANEEMVESHGKLALPLPAWVLEAAEARRSYVAAAASGDGVRSADDPGGDADSPRRRGVARNTAGSRIPMTRDHLRQSVADYLLED